MIVPNERMASEAVARHYNELDEFYREVWGEHVHHGLWRSGRETPDQAVEQLVHFVAELAEIQPGSRVCDVGCANGETSRLLTSEYHARVTGLTVSESQFQYACEQSTGSDNPAFLLRPWEDNDFEADSFDAVVSIECVSHVPDKSEFYRQIHRVLRTGGRAVVIAWLANPDAGRWSTRHLLEPICREGWLSGLATADEYRSMIANAGLTLESHEDVSRAVRRTWWIWARRLLWKLATRAKYVKAVLDRDKSNRVFAITLFQIIAAYHTDALQFGVFRIHKPDADAPRPVQIERVTAEPTLEQCCP